MKNAIITGSSNGFELKTAEDFAGKGYQVFATMRNPNKKYTCKSIIGKPFC